MKVRKTFKEDIDLLIKIRMEYLFAEKGVSSSEEVQDIRTKLEEYFTQHLNKGFIAIIAENENEVVLATAFMSIVERPPLIAFSSYLVGTVYNVFTYPQYRGKGIATKVMTELLSESKLLGVAAVDLMSTEKGKPLYGTLGFRVSNYTSMNKFL
ncbi:GNAT family N-acetyltransferase [Clostridium lacusfryxellense]|uniref:GNAT family N-acetyltransferase n=1 Tax=Clostridium lacusfryxellense TaxID=205328 RepID=UPI001C0B6097|nr:GNAT family N-acetyltransferase [Clostridium lacusfryxellense]MBU3113666.1 GNAT family N-acetyltransferase [Clostridium lacusfryxellense]